MHGCEVERVYCLVVFGAGPGQRSSKHWMSSSELSGSQAVITPRSPTHSRQLTTPVTPEWCVCVCVFEKKGDWLRGRRKTKDKKYMCMRQVCILCYRKKKKKKCVCVRRRACGHSVSSEWVKAVNVCAVERRGGCIFSLLFLPPSLHVSLISHPSIFHFYMLLQMWRQWNIKLQKWACFCTSGLYQKQPSLSFLLTWHTYIFSHFDNHISNCAPTVHRRWTEQKYSNSFLLIE